MPKQKPRRQGSPIAVQIGARIRAARQARNLTARALAKAVGIPAPHISNLETGRVEPRSSTLLALAKAIGCRPADLLPTEASLDRGALEARVAALPDEALPELDRLLSLLERASYRNQ